MKRVRDLWKASVDELRSEREERGRRTEVRSENDEGIGVGEGRSLISLSFAVTVYQ
jgi:hypothetical protein